MSLAAGRASIARYFADNWTYDIPLGMDGHTFTPVHRSARLTITEGARRQSSIGRVANVVYRVGLITAQIYTTGGAGSDAWRVIGDLIIDMTHGKTLDANGAVVLSQSQTPVIRFSPPELGDGAHPYIGGDADGVPFRQSNIVCPFVCYETR